MSCCAHAPRVRFGFATQPLPQTSIKLLREMQACPKSEPTSHWIGLVMLNPQAAPYMIVLSAMNKEREFSERSGQSAMHDT